MEDNNEVSKGAAYATPPGGTKAGVPPEMGSHMFKGIPHDESMGLAYIGAHYYPMTHPWDERYIYLHEWLIIMVHVGKYAMHGCYGYNMFKGILRLFPLIKPPFGMTSAEIAIICLKYIPNIP